MLNINPPAYSQNPGPASAPVSAIAAHSMRRGGNCVSGTSQSRERAPSPAGPRAPLARTRGDRKEKAYILQDSNRPSPPAPPGSESGSGRGGPRPQPPRRGYTYSQPATKGDVSTVQFPRQPQASYLETPRRPKSAIDLCISDPSRRMSTLVPGNPPPVVSNISAAGSTVPCSVPATTIHVPTPVSMSRPLLEIEMAVDSTLSSPQPTTIKQPMAMDGSDINRLSAQTSTQPSDIDPRGRWSHMEPVQARGRRVASRRIISRTYEGQDKENHGRTTVVTEETRDRPVGLGVGRDMGREMGNVTHLPDGETIKEKKDKDKKSRRAHLLLGTKLRLTSPP